MTRLLAIGGAHVDRRGRFEAPFVPGASIPGRIREDVGGGAFNALRTAVRRGAAGTMLSLRGGDMAGDAVARAIAAEGIADRSAVYLDRATPSYTAMVDQGGEVVAALADMNLYEIGFPRQVRRREVRDAVAAADGLLVDANLPAAALHTLLAAGPKPFAIAVSPAKAPRLAGVAARLHCLFCNRREAAAIAGPDALGAPAVLVAALRRLGVSIAVVSDGPRMLVAYAPSETWLFHPPRPRTISDVTGAGDALAGAAFLALVEDAPLVEAVRQGLAAAVLAVETPATVPELSAGAFADALERVPPPQRLAD